MVSAVILTKDSEGSIKQLVRSLSWLNEVVVIDDKSQDNTVELARDAGAKVFSRELCNDFAAQRNFAMEKAVNDWVLFVDSDEKVSEELKEGILAVVTDSKGDENNIVAYKISRRDHFLGRVMKHGEVLKAYTDGIIRLVKKGSGFWVGKVHERYIASHGVTGHVNGYLDHYPHDSIKDFILDVNKYSSIRAGELHADGKNVSWFDIVSYPTVKFLFTFFWNQGYRDGPEGFIYSFMMSFHSFLTRGKLYLFKRS